MTVRGAPGPGRTVPRAPCLHPRPAPDIGGPEVPPHPGSELRMAAPRKGKYVTSTRMSFSGVAFILAFLVISFAFLVYSYRMFTEPAGVFYESLVILVAFIVWFAMLFGWFLPGRMAFHENGMVSSGLVPLEKGAGSRDMRLLERFVPWRDVDRVYLKVEEINDEGDISEKIRGDFIFRINGHDYRYRARGVDVEYLDETLIYFLNDRYLGTRKVRINY